MDSVRNTHPHSVDFGTVHVSEEEVTELDRIEAGKKEAPLDAISERVSEEETAYIGIRKPATTPRIENRRGQEEDDPGDDYQNDRIIQEHGIAAKSAKVEIYDETLKKEQKRESGEKLAVIGYLTVILYSPRTAASNPCGGGYQIRKRRHS